MVTEDEPKKTIQNVGPIYSLVLEHIVCLMEGQQSQGQSDLEDDMVFQKTSAAMKKQASKVS